jgi:hypothetical protein
MSIVKKRNGSSPVYNEVYETFIPALGQTIFTLGNVLLPSQITISKVYVNRVKVRLNSSYTILGSQLTIILPFTLDSIFIVEIYY